MEAKATLNYTRISPRKVGLVLDLIRNKPVDLAAAILKHTPKAACEDLEKLLKSAVANAENNFNMDPVSYTHLDVYKRQGFNSLSYFIGVFKQSMGCTPTEFRRRHGRQEA